MNAPSGALVLMNLVRFAALVVMLLAMSCAIAAEPPLRVMTFNIRYATAADGENAWDKRKDFVVEVIRGFDPDLLGTQEVLAAQADFLAMKLSGYAVVGVGRDDGQRRGEFSAAFYKSSRFKALDSGTFWLSETPDVPGSKSWDSSLPRVATWVKLRDTAGGDRELCFLNTHWDHRGNHARIESASIIRRWLAAHAPTMPAIVTGDFNVTEEHQAYREIISDSGDGRPLRDLYRQAHPERHPEEATFNGFRGTRQGRRIDFVLGTAEFRVSEADILRASRDGRYPSDHYPVTAVLSLGAK
jgi:endonuclease/exonuclease/phosphatase family metal-dependent hydrolase